MIIDLTTHDTQEIAQIAAAIALGNQRLESAAARATYHALLRLLTQDSKHYLFLRNTHIGSFFGCGSIRGAIGTMIEDGAICNLHAIPEAECPNCREAERDIE